MPWPEPAASKSGAGVLSLTVANANYSGAVSMTGGAVALSAGSSLGSGAVTLNGGGLRFDAALTPIVGDHIGRRQRHLGH